MSKRFQNDPVHSNHRRGSSVRWTLTSINLFLFPFLLITTGALYFLQPFWMFWGALIAGLGIAAILAYAVYYEYFHTSFEYVTDWRIAWSYAGKKFYSLPRRMHRFEKIIVYNLLHSDIDISPSRIKNLFQSIGIRVIPWNSPRYYAKDPGSLLDQRHRRITVVGDDSRSLGIVGSRILVEIFPYISPIGAYSDEQKREWYVEQGVWPLDIPGKRPEDPVELPS